MRCSALIHQALKESPAAWLAGTVRLPHHQHAEAVADGMWFRNCVGCNSTLVLVVEEVALAVAA